MNREYDRADALLGAAVEADMGGEVAVVASECLEAACQIERGAGQARDFAHGMRVDGDGGVEAE